jgi:hypothetical protein
MSGQETVDFYEIIDGETGEIVTFQRTAKGDKVYKTQQQARAERFALKSVVNAIFPGSRTAKCSRWRVPNQSLLILKNPEYKRAHYAGLQRCASVWACPVCAAKIAERRRAELVGAAGSARAMGLHFFLMTLTIPHGLGDDINRILDSMLSAWRKMTDNRAGKEVRKIVDLVGTIRALETTYGQNGFHPHFHVLIFTRRDISPAAMQALFLPLWQDACIKAKLPRPSDDRGCRVDDGTWAAKYASKWGLEDEMTKGHLKASRGVSGMTPWDMLRDVLKNGSEASRRLFAVYAEAFSGRRQLYWSNGLKKLLAVVEASDEELVALDDDHSFELAELTSEQWRAVLAHHCEAPLLDLAERDPARIPEFLQALMR